MPFITGTTTASTSNNITRSCIKAERNALLSFKAQITYHSVHPISSWGDQTEDCCQWPGVLCDINSGHVVLLDLLRTQPRQYHHDDDEFPWIRNPINCDEWDLSGNISESLIGLQQLTYLDLSGNCFINISIPKSLGSLQNLAYLGLSDSGFTGVVPHELGNLTRLRSLDLSMNQRLKVDWHNLTLNRSERGLGIKDPRIQKHALMAKNVLNYLNNSDALWVSIVRLKYGDLNFWIDHPPNACSYFLRGLFHTASLLKHNFWMQSCEPSSTSFLNQPWLFNIPLAFMPIPMNMFLNLNTLTVSDFIDNNTWNFDALQHVFGNSIYEIFPSLAPTSSLISNRWAWYPHSLKLSVPAKVYHYLIDQNYIDCSWDGWNMIWKLKSIPRVKHFIWLMVHGKLKTYDYLHSLNIGPQEVCIFCKLTFENAEHLLFNCPKSAGVWLHLQDLINHRLSFPNGFVNGDWLENSHEHGLYINSVCATVAWLLWKARCNKIFKNEDPRFHSIACRALAIVKDVYTITGIHSGKNLLFFNFRSTDGPFLFIAAYLNPSQHQNRCSFGFALSDSNYNVSLAGFTSSEVVPAKFADLKALCFALRTCIDSNHFAKHIFITSHFVHQVISNQHAVIDWRFLRHVQLARDMISHLGHPSVSPIHKSWNDLPFLIAKHGAYLHAPDLYFQGMDRPRWLMRACVQSGFSLV